MTVSEVLTKPFEHKKMDLVEQYQEIFQQAANLSVVSPTYDTAVSAAEIRADYGFRLIDSYQLAIARETNCRSFVTNDNQIKKYKDIKVFLLGNIN